MSTTVEFSIRVENLSENQQVAVVGSNRTLGFWKPHRAARLEKQEEGLWCKKIKFEGDENIFQMEYKYVVVGRRGEQERWLPGSNLKIKPPEVIKACDETWVLEKSPLKELSTALEETQEATTPKAVPPAEGKENLAISSVPATAPVPTRAQQPIVAQKSNASHEQQALEGVPNWYLDSVFYLVYCLGTPGYGGGGFYGDCPDVNDQVSDPVHRLRRTRHWYDYLVDLGVNAVYFTPIFDSGSHGYDTYDYFRVDRRLGDMEDFKAVLSELHERGIRVVLDGVFNHTGRGHFAFEDILSRGSKWAESPYREWYFLKEGRSSYGDKFNYESWSGHQVLPKLNMKNRDVRNHIIDVAKFWLEVGIDGWRLDCASDIAPEFWVEFRKACEEVRPDVALIGEIIHGNYNDWVHGTERLHSATNYQLYKPMWSSLNDRNFFELRHNIERDENIYAGKILMTFLGNHDVDRVLSILHNDKKMTTLAHVLLMTLKGVPCIYYGDECFTAGEKKHGGDAALRGPMLLPEDNSWDRTLFHVLKALTSLRAEHEGLRRGNITIDWNSNEAILFRRTLGSDTVAVAVNCGSKAATVEFKLAADSVQEYAWHPSPPQATPISGSNPFRATLEPVSARIFVSRA